MVLTSHLDSLAGSKYAREIQLKQIAEELSHNTAPLTVFGGDCNLREKGKLK